MSVAPSHPSPEARPFLVALIALSLVALAVRLYAAHTVGFGDSEALYASYALFPAPAYLDHPGLIGALARALGHGLAPSPLAAHTFTAVAMTLAPWAIVAACRALGAGARASIVAAIAVAGAPEIAIGLFGMTPDLLLFFAWTATLALFGRALLAPAGSTTAATLFVGAGLALGLACSAKVSAILLGLALVAAILAPAGRPHARTLWPWVTFALATVIFAPVVLFEARTGWPMVLHRLVDTQHDASVSLRNAGALIGGQAAYISPVLMIVGLLLGRELFQTRTRDAVRSLLWYATLVPLVGLGLLCLWSRVAEPHWLAPVWLTLPLYYARAASERADGKAPFSRRLGIAGIAVALASSTLVYAWVLVPKLVSLVPERLYDPRVDIANELYGWPELTADVADDVLLARIRLGNERDTVAVVGSVWMVAAQLRAALPADVPVGCAGPNPADFARWAPPAVWSRAELVVYVHDNRAPSDSAKVFPDRVRLGSHTRTIMRGTARGREITVEVLSRRGSS